MSFLAPAALIGLALAVPIILMYMLRLRRREISVPSTFLWQQILRDREANTPWQKLRRNLLLFLQLIILAFIVLALARPFILVPALTAGQVVLLLDASASMNATDSPAGTRFEEAKMRALEIVDTLGDADSMTVIRVAGSPEVLAAATNDRALLRSAIQAAQPSSVSADWEAALTLAAAGAIGADDFDVVIIGDGGLGEAARLPAPPGDLIYIPVGTSDANVAISALAVRSLPGQPPQLFAQITNYGGRAVEVVFDLRVDGDLFTARRYPLAAGEALPLISTALPQSFTTIQAGLTLPNEYAAFDVLPTDNTAYTVAPPVGGRRALVMTDGNLFLEQIMRTLPTISAFQATTAAGLPSGIYDLYIFDGWLPTLLPAAGDLLIINPPRSTSLFTITGESANSANIRVRRDDPRMAFVDFDSVNILRFKTVSAAWAEPLISADGGALLLAGEQGGQQIAILTFDLRESDLPLQIAFPVLMSALVDWFAPPGIFNAPEGIKAGEALPLRLPPAATSVRIRLPDGDVRVLENEPPLLFTETSQLGIYRADVLDGQNVTESGLFAVNLFDANESSIAPRQTIQLGAVVASQSAEEEIGQREFWSWLALAALGVLLVEWIVHHRRQRARYQTAPRVPIMRRLRGNSG